MTAEQYLTHLHAVYEQFQLPFQRMPPASEADLATLADVLGPLDTQLTALWRITRGSSTDSDQPMFQRPGFVDALDFLTPQRSIAQAQAMEKRAQRMWDLAGPASDDRRLTGRWWHTGWQPFASFYGDIVLLIDHHPGPEGTVGQVIAYVHDPDHISWIAPSFGAYLQAAADSMDQDREEFLNGPLEGA
ncbi:SMI1/KNR4 family protein [Comamonas sp. lk]|uniref:SMI1/KNR4 family protein n=1 Tax=Comamonas sp. lk TaxID=2201272 RepID=UPI000EACCC43|nr:SMI1/KNR4 family protein [Comamonas sp. lk]